MAGDNKIYARVAIVADGDLLCEETSVTITRETGSNAVDTVINGYSGESPGSPKVMVDVENVVPAAGFEFDVGSFMSGMTPIEMSGFVGNAKIVIKGFVIEDSLKHGVNNAATYSFKVRGKFQEYVV